MTHLNFDYNLYCDENPKNSTGHFNYSISHFVNSLLQQKIASLQTPETFWEDFDAILNQDQLWRIAEAIQNENLDFLSGEDQVHLMAMLHSFGFYALEDITKEKPQFCGKGKRTFLACDKGETMYFHLQKEKGWKIEMGRRVFHACFTRQWQQKPTIRKNGTFVIDIYDPESKWTKRDHRLYEKARAHENEFFQGIGSHEFTFAVKGKTMDVDVHFALHALPDFEQVEDQYSDGVVFIYSIPRSK